MDRCDLCIQSSPVIDIFSHMQTQFPFPTFKNIVNITNTNYLLLPPVYFASILMCYISCEKCSKMNSNKKQMPQPTALCWIFTKKCPFICKCDNSIRDQKRCILYCVLFCFILWSWRRNRSTHRDVCPCRHKCHVRLDIGVSSMPTPQQTRQQCQE